MVSDPQDIMNQLHATLLQVFADGVLEQAEREALNRLYRHGGLTVSQVREVFARFVAEVWGEALADGVITPGERAKVELIVRELKLRPDMLPPDLRRHLEDQSAP